VKFNTIGKSITVSLYSFDPRKRKEKKKGKKEGSKESLAQRARREAAKDFVQM
jgi:hypothetical protein